MSALVERLRNAKGGSYDVMVGGLCHEAADEIERLTTWRPMDTAPRDGSEVLLKVERRAGMPGKCLVGHHMPGGHCIEDHPPIDEGWYFWNGREFDRAAKPRAWLPLPEEAAEAKGGE